MNIRNIFNSFVRILSLQKINKNNYENNVFNEFIYDDKIRIHFMMEMVL
jgi:hypothetical protein